MQQQKLVPSVSTIVLTLSLALIFSVFGPLGDQQAEAAPSYAALAPKRTNDGHWTVDPSGVVVASGNAAFLGDLRGHKLNAPIVGVAPAPGDSGYWLVASDGGIFSFGNAQFMGSTGAIKLNRPIVGMAATPDGRGYWLVASDGGIFAFGNAGFQGSTGAITLNKPIVGMSATPDGQGYWLVASDGGIFAFGNAGFQGSTGAITLNEPIVGMASTPSGRGYWLVASDGGIFAFGDATFQGAALEGNAPVFGLAPDASGGYSVLRTDGSIARRTASTTPTPRPSNPIPNTPVPTVPVPANPGAAVPSNPSGTGNPFAGKGLWVDPNNPAKAQAAAWQASRPADAARMLRMGNTAAAAWIGDWTPDLSNSVRAIVDAAKNQNTVPVLVAYNIPDRDCGQWSSGGAANAAAYEAWINSFSAGLGNGPAAIVLEPDALSLLDCGNASSKESRLASLRYAVQKLSSRPNTSVYLDAGHPGWHTADEMASRLQQAGIAGARGFALNVSNYATTADNTAYGNDVSSRLNNKPFVIDTSRNGNGTDGNWCNPLGRALGASPTANTGSARIDALLWLKRPGESDGECNGGPRAGVWWPDYALDLAKSAWG